MQMKYLNNGDNIQEALTRLESTGGALTLAAGNFRSKQLLRYESEHPVSIFGQGAGLSRLIFNSSSGGLKVQVEDEFRAGPMLFSGFGIYPTDHLSNDGFRLSSFQSNIGGPRPGSAIRDVVVSTVPGRWRRGGSFSNGVVLENMPHTDLEHVYVYGGEHGDGFRFLGDSTPGGAMISCRAYHFYSGIGNGGRHEDNTEGTSVISCILVNNRIGIRWEDTSGEPGLQVIGGHIASIESNIKLRKAHQCTLDGFLGYRRPDQVAEFADIDAEDCITLTVRGVQTAVRGPDTPSVLLRARNINGLTFVGNTVQGRSRHSLAEISRNCRDVVEEANNSHNGVRYVD